MIRNEQFLQQDLGIETTFLSIISEYNNEPYAPIACLLSYLRFVTNTHQLHHWVAKGSNSYSDHLLFERLYDESSEEIDQLAEKIIGVGNSRLVGLAIQSKQMFKLANTEHTNSLVPVIGVDIVDNMSYDCIFCSLKVEQNFLWCIAYTIDLLEESGLLTNGLDNLLQGLADKHEEHVYLLKQRQN